MNMSSGALRTPPVVKNLLIINGLVFLAQMLLPNGIGNWMIAKFALFFWESQYFHVYQFLTHIFLHGDISHLFLNMFSLWMFGRILEYDLGSKRFLIFYLVCGVGAGLFYSLVNWIEIGHLVNIAAENPEAISKAISLINTPSIGASGAVYGILFAFGMIHPNSTIMLLIPPIPMKAKYFVLIFMVLEILAGLMVNDNIAHFAHVGGMLWAFLLLKIWKVRKSNY